MNDQRGPVSGHCDGLRGPNIHGWAWRPGHPDDRVEIELLMDGELVATTIADQYRDDLRKASIGDGRYGWHLPFPRELVGQRPQVHVLARAGTGEALVGGVFVFPSVPSAEDQANPAFIGFVAHVLGLPDSPPRLEEPKRVGGLSNRLNIMFHGPAKGDGTSLGRSEYSYGFAAKAYREFFETLASVHEVDGAPDDIDARHVEFVARGEGSIVLSFFPPHRMPLAMRAPLVPMIAWEYPTLPDGSWSEALSDDWRFVLRQAGRVVVASEQTAAAVRAGMGASFPVVVIPHPVFDRTADAGPLPTIDATTEITVDGFVFDTRIDGVAWLGDVAGEGGTNRANTTLGGAVFTSVFAPKDGRKAWQDTTTAFVDAHRDDADATLVLKTISADAAEWRWELHEILSRERPFACRIVVIHGYLDEANYARLIAATHWIVSATLAEGQCMPLLEFMSAARPAITATHSAMADYVTASNALLIEHCEERCAWPQDGSNRLLTSRARLDWTSLRDGLRSARAMIVGDRARYEMMGRDARETMRAYCSDDVVAERLDAFLGLNVSRARRPAAPSRLVDLADVAA